MCVEPPVERCRRGYILCGKNLQYPQSSVVDVTSFMYAPDCVH